MTCRSYFIKLVILFVALFIILAGVQCVTTIANTIISNHLALGQLENDDAGYIFMELYNNLLRPCGSVLVFALYLSLFVLFAYYTIKFIITEFRKGKNNNEKNS